MEDDDRTKTPTAVELGGDLSTLSLGDIDERVALLETEITRLKSERDRKSSSLSAAEQFFKR